MRVTCLAVPYDTGRRDFRMGRGPGRLLQGGLESVWRRHHHEITTEWLEAPAAAAGDVRSAFDLYTAIARRVANARAAGSFPLVLAGNCGATLGAVAGLGAEPTAVVWCDAHADFNTPETSPSGFLDGMALAILTGRCWHALAAAIPEFAPLREDHVVLVGSRDLDAPESRALDQSAIRRVGPDLAGLEGALAPAVRRAYLHIDLDVLDPSVGHANQFAAPGGLSLAALQSAVRRVAVRVPLAGAALTAYDPGADSEGRIAAAALAVVETLAEVCAGRP